MCHILVLVHSPNTKSIKDGSIDILTLQSCKIDAKEFEKAANWRYSILFPSLVNLTQEFHECNVNFQILQIHGANSVKSPEY